MRPSLTAIRCNSLIKLLHQAYCFEFLNITGL